MCTLVTGIMSSCPAYLGLAVFGAGAEVAADTLLRADLLIFCPPNFTVTVRVAAPPVC